MLERVKKLIVNDCRRAECLLSKFVLLHDSLCRSLSKRTRLEKACELALKPYETDEAQFDFFKGKYEYLSDDEWLSYFREYVLDDLIDNFILR